MSDTLSMAETANRVRVSAERFRKVWKTWCRTMGFPPPIAGPGALGGTSYKWLTASIEAWYAARLGALGGAGAPPPAANEDRLPHVAAVSATRLARQRAQARQLRAQRS